MASKRVLTNDDIRNRVTKIYAQFVKDVSAETLSDWLIQESVLSHEEWDDIKTKELAKVPRCRALLSYLFMKGHPRAFLILREALVEDNHYIVDDIDNLESSTAMKADSTQNQELQKEPKSNAKSSEVEQMIEKIKELEDELKYEREEKEKMVRKNKDLEEEKKRWRNDNERIKELEEKLRLIERMKVNKKKTLSGEKDLVTVIPGTNCILGITILDSQIFMCRIRSPDVDVYDADSYQKLRTFAVPALQDPSDMTCCSVNSVIYINGNEDRCIYKLDNDGRILDEWNPNEKPFRISTDDAGFVTVTYREKLTIKRYTSDGKIQKAIRLPADMKSPRNAYYMTASDTFVVCHGELGEALHRVCELSSDGHLLRCYGGKEGSAPTLINVPVHLIKAPDGRFLVADLNNRRIHLIDNFKLVTHILTADEDEIKLPRKLAIYEDKLFVAQDDGSVAVFQVTF